MNKQGKLVHGKVSKGIEWTKTIHPDGTESRGYTWNPVGGCQHGCRWEMPDGTIAECYAETVAERVAQSVYPQGFEHHYWRPDQLEKPLRVRKPAKIFLDSMSDIMGAWVPEEQVMQVLDIVKQAHWHTFQLLTKNAPMLLRYADRLPSNLWVGVSAPPTFMFGKRLSENVQRRMLGRQLKVLDQLEVPVRWMSIEPLSFDIADMLHDVPMEWAVIGAATNGRNTYQPNPKHVQNVLDVLDEQNIPVFFKGNLDWTPWREQFPEVNAVTL